MSQRKKDKMKTAKLFQNGNFQAIRLPRAFRVHCGEVKNVKKAIRLYWNP